MIRSILAVLAGTLIAFIAILVFEMAGTKIFPPPPRIDSSDPQSVRTAMAKLPMGALLCVLAAQGVGTFSGAWLAALIARRARAAHALIVGSLLMLAGIANLLLLPHPAWFWAASLFLYLPTAFLGQLLVRREGSSNPS